jgi:hypothetical protein
MTAPANHHHVDAGSGAKSVATASGGVAAGVLIMFLLNQAFGVGQDVARLQASQQAVEQRLERVETLLDRLIRATKTPK